MVFRQGPPDHVNLFLLGVVDIAELLDLDLRSGNFFQMFGDSLSRTRPL